jgi:ABC-type phosphate transport system substrate-binding protein
MKKSMMCALAALAGCGVLTSALDARAADCSTYPNPVYISGSTASMPVWVALGATFAAMTPPVSIIYQGPSSCVGLADVMGTTPDPIVANYMDGSPSGITCTNPGAVTIGASDVFPTTCPNTMLPTGFKDFQGPVQVMLMAVPFESTATAISADAAYTVFGWGGLAPYQVAPWTNLSNIFVRSQTSGTELMIGSAIGLPASKWLGQDGDAGVPQMETSSGNVVTAVVNAGAGASPSSAIGIVAADKGDQFRGAAGTNDAGKATGGLKILAYQAADQSCGYLPDSDSTHFDKINVRQGRYDIWGPIHLVTAVNPSGTPTNAQAATLLNMITAASGTTDAQLQTVIQADATAFVIPQCAMQVSRSAEVMPVTGGGIASYQPPAGCGCYYESIKNGGTPYSKYCTPCGSGCAAPYPVCHFGFCEAQ